MHPPYIYISTLQTTRRVLQIVVIACCPLPCPSSFASSGYIMLESGQLFYLSAPTEKCLVAVFSSPHPHPPIFVHFRVSCSRVFFSLLSSLFSTKPTTLLSFLPPCFSPLSSSSTSLPSLLPYPPLSPPLHPASSSFLSFFFFFLLFSRLFSSACFPEVLFSRVILRARLRQNSPRIPTLSLSP